MLENDSVKVKLITSLIKERKEQGEEGREKNGEKERKEEIKNLRHIWERV